jgi:single-strand DNA-binding protein
MRDLNCVHVVGNLSQDPVSKGNSNNSIVEFSIASNRDWTGSEGEKASEVSFINCKAFNKTADIILQHLTKGRRVLIEGKIRQERWVDKATLKNRSKLMVIVDNFYFMDSKKTNKDETIPVVAGNESDVEDFDAI